MKTMADLERIVAEVLQLPSGSVRPELQRHEVETWDSLGHLRVISELEEQLQITIPIEDFNRIECVGDFEKYLR